jgi:hypothetical protein
MEWGGSFKIPRSVFPDVEFELLDPVLRTETRCLDRRLDFLNMA